MPPFPADTAQMAVAAETINCTNCGSELPASAKFCNKCGSTIGGSQTGGSA
jgi:ribosomal protein L40E